MKMSVKLTADELANVVDSVVDTAIDNGFDCIVEDDEEFNAIFAIVDAALEAMGISIEEDEDEDEESYDEDEDEDEDEEEEDDPAVRFPGIAEMVYEKDGRGAISEEDAHNVLDSMKAMIAESCPELNPMEKFELLTKMWLQFGEDFGIEVVDMGE